MASVYLGTIQAFGFNFPPRGWAFCQGQLLSIAQNTALFSLLGTQYGGNGTTNFALPDLRGRVPNGQGQGPGLSSYTIGQQGGTETTTLLTSNLPAHTHTQAVSTAKATTQVAAAGSYIAKSVDTSTDAVPAIYVPAGSQGTTVGLGGAGITGNGIPFSIQDPYLTINWSIALQGIFPSRN